MEGFGEVREPGHAHPARVADRILRQDADRYANEKFVPGPAAFGDSLIVRVAASDTEPVIRFVPL